MPDPIAAPEARWKFSDRADLEHYLAESFGLDPQRPDQLVLSGRALRDMGIDPRRGRSGAMLNPFLARATSPTGIISIGGVSLDTREIIPAVSHAVICQSDPDTGFERCADDNGAHHTTPRPRIARRRRTLPGGGARYRGNARHGCHRPLRTRKRPTAGDRHGEPHRLRQQPAAGSRCAAWWSFFYWRSSFDHAELRQAIHQPDALLDGDAGSFGHAAGGAACVIPDVLHQHGSCVQVLAQRAGNLFAVHGKKPAGFGPPVVIVTRPGRCRW